MNTEIILCRLTKPLKKCVLRGFSKPGLPRESDIVTVSPFRQHLLGANHHTLNVGRRNNAHPTKIRQSDCKIVPRVDDDQKINIGSIIAAFDVDELTIAHRSSDHCPNRRLRQRFFKKTNVTKPSGGFDCRFSEPRGTPPLNISFVRIAGEPVNLFSAHLSFINILRCLREPLNGLRKEDALLAVVAVAQPRQKPSEKIWHL